MSSAELTLGTPLRIPGEFFVSERESVPQTEYGKQLIRFMSTLRLTPSRAPSRREYYVDEKLSTCSHVYVRNESATTSLDRAYIGPNRVLEREEKYFTVELGVDRVDNVSVNRLKPRSLLFDLPEYEPREPAHHLSVVPESVNVSAPKSPILEAGRYPLKLKNFPCPIGLIALAVPSDALYATGALFPGNCSGSPVLDMTLNCPLVVLPRLA